MTQDFFSAVRVSKFSSSSASFLPVKAPPGPHLFRFLPRLPHKKPGPQSTRYFCAPHPARFPDGNSPDAATARPPRWRWRRGWGEIKQFGGVHGNGTRDAVALPEAGLLRKFRTSRTKPVFPRGEQQATPVIPLVSPILVWPVVSQRYQLLTSPRLLMKTAPSRPIRVKKALLSTRQIT